MKILFLVNHFAEYGGIQRMLDHKFLAFKNYSNHEIILVTRLQGNRAYLYESHSLTKKYDLNLDNKQTFFDSLKNTFSFYRRLNHILKQEKPAVVITTLTSYNSLIVPFICKKIPKIIEFHSTANTIKAGQWKFKKYFYGLYDAVVVLNEDEKNSYELKNSIVIPNFIHQESSLTLPEFNKRKLTLIAAGRLETVKQFDHLILAWAKINKQHPDWNLEIYGEGSLRNKLQELINNKNLSNQVSLKGNTHSLGNLMRISSIYCMTSLTDCFPMVLLEAKQAGLPIISYDCPYGPKHIICQNQDGFLIEDKNIEAFSIALEKLILDNSGREKMAENSFKNFEEFSSKKIIQLWFNLFEKLTTKNDN